SSPTEPRCARRLRAATSELFVARAAARLERRIGSDELAIARSSDGNARHRSLGRDRLGPEHLRRSWILREARQTSRGGRIARKVLGCRAMAKKTTVQSANGKVRRVA